MNWETEDLLLFNKEVASRGFKYRLYFVLLPSLKAGIPKIRRFICLRPKSFRSAALGKVYDVSYRKRFLKTLYETGEEFLNEDDYRYLIGEKDRLFRRSQPVSAFSSLHPANTSGGCYYPFDDLRQLTSYRAPFAAACFYRLLYALCLLLSLLLPFAAFAWSIYEVSAMQQAALPETGRHFWVLPVYYFASVPLMLFLMTLFTTLTDVCLLRFNGFKWMVLKKHAYITGGMRKGVCLHKKQKTRLLTYGLFTGGLYITGLAMILLL